MFPPRAWLALSATGFLAASAVASAQQTSLGVHADDTPAWYFREQAGRRVSFVCPASDRWFRPVWGTDVYTADTKLCSAAIHAGKLKFGQPGLVTIVIGAHEEPYVGSERNGVTSDDYGAWPMSFTFDESAPGEIEWKTSATGVPADLKDTITVVCPGKGDLSGLVWGTEMYTIDSSICVAAVHAGVMTTAGGPVQLTMTAGRDDYSGTERNGVISRSWGKQTQSYVFAASGKSDAGGRTIQLAGFSAAGVAKAAIARTIQLEGFSATGTAPETKEPRTIQLKGWTGTGLGTKPRGD